MYHLELVRPLFHDLDDEEPFCLSSLQVQCPVDFEPTDPTDAEAWLDVFAWVAEEYPDWLPKNYYWLENE